MILRCYGQNSSQIRSIIGFTLINHKLCFYIQVPTMTMTKYSRLKNGHQGQNQIKCFRQRKEGSLRGIGQIKEDLLRIGIEKRWKPPVDEDPGYIWGVKAECHAIDIMYASFFLDGQSYYSLNNGKSAFVRIRCRMLQVSSASNSKGSIPLC